MKAFRIFFCATFFISALIANIQAQIDLELRLFELPDVVFTKTDTPKGFDSAYELMIKQPLDHSDPDKGHFYQKVFLSHLDYDAPMVIITEGYTSPGNLVYELTSLLGANQINVEHRYFGDSKPAQMDYQYLNLEQVTADLHKIKTLFEDLYSGKWVSTGISKGGQTSLFYKYFYPDDVQATVAYVAPLNDEYEEDRIYAFLDKAGTPECRKAMYDLQCRLLKNRDEVLPLLKMFVKGRSLSFDYLGFEEAFEYAVLEYPFAFWQYGHYCEDIPDGSNGLWLDLEHLLDKSGISLFADKNITFFGSHYYQAATEMGYYGYKTEPFRDLLKALPLKPHPHAAFIPGKIKTTFDGQLLDDVHEWIQKEGDQIIYIYGEIDTWSATAVNPSPHSDALKIVMPGKSHGNARIRNMTAENKLAVVQKLESWLNIKISEKD